MSEAIKDANNDNGPTSRQRHKCMGSNSGQCDAPADELSSLVSPVTRLR